MISIPSAANRALPQPPYGVVIIDMQDEALADQHRPENVSRMIAQQQRVLVHATSVGAPVFFVEINPSAANHTTIALTARAPTAKIYRKEKQNAFEDELFRRAVEESNIDYLVLAGIRRSECVWETAQGAHGKYKVLVAQDTVDDPRKGPARDPFRAFLYERADIWYRQHISLFRTTDELIERLKAIPPKLA